MIISKKKISMGRGTKGKKKEKENMLRVANVRGSVVSGSKIVPGRGRRGRDLRRGIAVAI